jgi:hypothetical protein
MCTAGHEEASQPMIGDGLEVNRIERFDERPVA